MTHTKQTLTKLSDQALLENFSRIVRFERKATAQVVVHLAEIYARRLYAQEGYSSLFAYIKEKFHYSGSSAYRRIQVARLSLQFPEIIDHVMSGNLNLVAICLLEPHMTAKNGTELISQAMGKTKEEIEYQLAHQFPRIEKTEDKIRRLPVIKKDVSVALGSEVKETPNKTSTAPVPVKMKDVGTSFCDATVGPLKKSSRTK